MIYRDQLKTPHIHFVNDDFRNQLAALVEIKNAVIVTDPPFNIGYGYGTYKDRMPEGDYYNMLADLVSTFPSVIIHYPEQLHELSIACGKSPEKVVSWVYNSNTAKQHRDVAFYGIKPRFDHAWQPYKNQNDRRIKERMANGARGGAYVRLVECEPSKEHEQG